MACTPLAVAPLGGPKYCVEFESRLGAGLHRAAHRVGLERQLAELDRLARNADDRDLAVGDFKIFFGAFEMLRGELEDLLPDRFRRFVDGVAGDDRAAARKGAGAPVELIGVAGDDVDIAHVDADLIGGDLGKAVKCPCPWVPMPVATLTLPLA